jgi:hypothetical protein
MNNRHKYFRNLRYKQKLETQYNNRDYSWSRVYFVTKEPDPRYAREWGDRLYYRIDKKYRGHDYYLYYDRPEVPYSIIEYTDRPYGKSKKFYKKYTSRVIRHSKDVLQHNQYRKQFDLWWTID